MTLTKCKCYLRCTKRFEEPHANWSIMGEESKKYLKFMKEYLSPPWNENPN